MRPLLLSVYAAACLAAQAPQGAEQFAFQASPDRIQGPGWRVAGLPRKYFSETLPALFERTLRVENLAPGSGGSLQWIFTGEEGGFTVETDGARLRVFQRYYNSPGFRDPGQAQPRHPQRITAENNTSYTPPLQSITVRFDHRLGLSVLINGVEVARQNCQFDVSRHQLAWTGTTGGARGYLEPAATQTATVRAGSSRQYQEMLGWGGIAIPTAYHQLSREGKRRWFQYLAEYNLLLQREYPIGAKLNPAMDNWDKLEDATPHYYGDNFPNGEISDFTYNRNVRRLGGKVLFEFWALPPWARRDWRDPSGKLHTGVADPESYAKAMVRYCQVAKERAGAPPEIVGIQNEVVQPPEIWHEMTLALRQALDAAGFKDVKIHMRDDGRLKPGIECARVFRARPDVWRAIDYSATHMYDFQSHFYDPDSFDPFMKEFAEAAAGKPFLSTELSVNNSEFQVPSYRIALSMGQLYHKNLVITQASGIMYCWTLLNVEQPSYGWTRTLFVPDPAHGFQPKPSSHQLRVFGAYSRRIKEGMRRVEASSSEPHLLVTAFEGPQGRTLVLLNRSLAPQKVNVEWPGASFKYAERVSPYHENEVEPAPAAVMVEPGAVVTLSSVELGRLTFSPVE